MMLGGGSLVPGPITLLVMLLLRHLGPLVVHLLLRIAIHGTRLLLLLHLELGLRLLPSTHLVVHWSSHHTLVPARLELLLVHLSI